MAFFRNVALSGNSARKFCQYRFDTEPRNGRDFYGSHLHNIGCQGAPLGVARDQANERIANLSTLSEALRKDTAEANARAAEAQLELAKFKEPRQLTSEQQARISGKLIGFAGQQYLLSVATDQDALRLVRILENVLTASKWVILPHPSGVKLADIDAGISGASEEGVRIQVAPSRASDNDLLHKASVLADALNAEGIITAVARNAELEPTPDAIQIRVGAKPK